MRGSVWGKAIKHEASLKESEIFSNYKECIVHKGPEANLFAYNHYINSEGA